MLLQIFGFLLLLGLDAQAQDTYEIPLTDAIEIHMRNDIHRLLPEEKRKAFYEKYYEESKGALEVFSITSVIDRISKEFPCKFRPLYPLVTGNVWQTTR